MIPIENKNARADWNAIRAEYITGNAGYRELAAKYGVSFGTLRHRAQKEEWVKKREDTLHKVDTISTQKTAEAIADNATIAQDIKKKLLLRLQRIEEKYPLDATEVRTRQGNSTAIFRIRDLTAAYKDLTEDLPKAEADKNAPIYELLRKLDGECDVQ